MVFVQLLQVNPPDDDQRYLLNLGLVVRSQEGGLKIANPIYQEVIPRVLSQGV